MRSVTPRFLSFSPRSISLNKVITFLYLLLSFFQMAYTTPQRPPFDQQQQQQQNQAPLEFPYIGDVSQYDRIDKIGQGTFGYIEIDESKIDLLVLVLIL